MIFGNLILRKVFVATTAHQMSYLRLKCTKFIFDWGSASDPAFKAGEEKGREREERKREERRGQRGKGRGEKGGEGKGTGGENREGNGGDTPGPGPQDFESRTAPGYS